MKKEKITKDGTDLYDLADSKELRKMGSERIRELLDQTYEMRKNSPKTNPSSASPPVAYVWEDYIDEWISVAEDELQRRENRADFLALDQS